MSDYGLQIFWCRYRKSGNAFVEKIKKKAPTIGGFNGMMKVPSRYKNPVLVSGTDGVGTKINIAGIARDYTTIGIDLVGYVCQ